MASKQIFEEVYTQTNIILCIKPQKVYLIEEKKVFGSDNSKGYTLIFRLWKTFISKVWGFSYLPFSHEGQGCSITAWSKMQGRG